MLGALDLPKIMPNNKSPVCRHPGPADHQRPTHDPLISASARHFLTNPHTHSLTYSLTHTQIHMYIHTIPNHTIPYHTIPYRSMHQNRIMKLVSAPPELCRRVIVYVICKKSIDQHMFMVHLVNWCYDIYTKWKYLREYCYYNVRTRMILLGLSQNDSDKIKTLINSNVNENKNWLCSCL